MALLQGQVSFEALEEARRGLEGTPSVDREKRVLDELIRLGFLTRETLDALLLQVEDLERFLSEVQADAEVSNPEETPIQSATNVELITAADCPTTARALWVTMPNPGLAPDNRSILSVLKLPRWSHYVNLQFVGEGGMGRIFRAFDKFLKRPVALKFLRREDRSLVHRLFLEAQRQAQVDHPNICKVYEVAEWHGQAFVAMQFIEGDPLHRLSPRLDMMEKVRLVELVAEAVHAAHRQNLIHRDLKPANIMVERSEDGEYKPYVLDFGLARDISTNGDTVEGSILGTYHYMSPEQARGDISQIDRRTDIYALGTTLYELLSGSPPFADSKGVDCLTRILIEDVPPLRKVVPEVPRDLETIVMKCLEKPKDRRYESARALAEDLRRFRDGEPILARPATLGYRLGKLGRKYKFVAGLMGAALLFMLGFAIVAIQARVTAASRAHWAQHFGQEAERIEALLRYSRLQPIHDVRPELNIVKTRIQALEVSIQGSRGAAQGPGSYALGRAYLALGDFAKARVFLDQAYAAGFRDKSLAYARGRALSQLYNQAIQQARAIQNPELRKARLQELEETLREPALRLLREGQGSLLDPIPFQEGLLAFHAGRYLEAIGKAREAAKLAPWFYEARRLEAEIQMEQARLAKDSTQSLALLNEADLALGEAKAKAPSDPELCDLEARRWWDELVARRQMGWELEEVGQKMELACARWNRILPGTPDALSRRACWYVESARDGRMADKAVRLERAQEGVRLAEQALALAPDHPEALGALAAGLRFQAYAAMEQSRDPRPVLDRVIQLLNQAMARTPDSFEFIDQLAMAYAARIEYEKTIGLNPAASLQQAVQAMELVVSRFPRAADFEAHIASFFVEQADFEANHGIDPTASVNQALVRLQRAVQRLPERFDIHFSIGNAHLTRGWYLLLHGGDGIPDLDEAETAYLKAMALNPKNVNACLGLVETTATKAWILQTRGESPDAMLAKAASHLSEAEALETPGWRNDYYRAEWALVAGRAAKDPGEARAKLLEAERRMRQLPASVGLQPQVLWLSAQVQVAIAERSPQESLKRIGQAELQLRKALQVDPKFEPARQMLGSVLARRSRKA